jgi:hypothetical protein
MAFRLEKTRRRHSAVHEDDTLLCLTDYKKGARSVIERLRELSESVTPDARKEVVYAPRHGIAVS